MKKMRKKYVVPLVTKHIVELEEGVCATGSIMSDAKSGVEASEHKTGFQGDFNANDGFEIDGMTNDNTGWN